MFVTIINDCNSLNDFGRQATRIFSLFGYAPVITVGIQFGGTCEAGGNLVDMLDAAGGQDGIILVNAAPRHGLGKKWPNGTPFGYFYYKKTLVISTVDGYCLSLVKKLGLLNTVYITDVSVVVDAMIAKKLLAPELRDNIVKSQFRSFEYVPRLAKWLTDKKINVPHKEYPKSNIADAPDAIWLVDGFGNCKTTMLAEEAGHKPGKIFKTKIGELTCYGRLKDVPDGQPGLIIGSSGFRLKRFLEIVVQGKSAAEKFKLAPGSEIF